MDKRDKIFLVIGSFLLILFWITYLIFGIYTWEYIYKSYRILFIITNIISAPIIIIQFIIVLLTIIKKDI